MTQDYCVEWRIEVEADTPMDAAIQALYHQTRPGTPATGFDVYDDDGEVTTIDIAEHDPPIAVDISAELLQALEDLLDHPELNHDEVPRTLVTRIAEARAVIAKVKAL